MTASAAPALESAGNAEETETGRSAAASRSLGAGAGSHDADAGDAAEAACAGEGEEEITAEMIQVGIESLESFMLDGEILRLERKDAVRAVFQAMRSVQLAGTSPACASRLRSK